MEIVWRSDAELNPVGLEARLVDMNGEKTLEAVFDTPLTLTQKIRAMWMILVGKPFKFASIYVGELKRK